MRFRGALGSEGESESESERMCKVMLERCVDERVKLEVKMVMIYLSFHVD